MQWSMYMKECTTTENSCRKMFHKHLRIVSEKQFSIAKTLSNKMSAFRAQLKAQDKNISYLVDVRRVPKVYVAFLTEVARRRRSTIMLKMELRKTSRRLNRLREMEIEHRETFIRRHGRAVVADLVPAIANVRPMSIDVRERTSESDESLPDIDLDQRTMDVYHKLGEDMASLVSEVREESIGMLGMEEGGGGEGGEGGGGGKVEDSEVESSGIPSSLEQHSDSTQAGGSDGRSVDWERRCVDLEYRNAQLRASIVSENIGHEEMKLKNEKINVREEEVGAEGSGSSGSMTSMTREEDGQRLQVAMRAFPSLMGMLEAGRKKERDLLARLQEVEANQTIPSSTTTATTTKTEKTGKKEEKEEKEEKKKEEEEKEKEKEVTSLTAKIQSLEADLEKFMLERQSEKAESQRLKTEITKYRTLYENEKKKRLTAIQESEDVQVMNRALVKEHKELLTASQTSITKSTVERDRQVEELTASMITLQVRDSLLSKTATELTEQILMERKKTKNLMSSAVFWKSTEMAEVAEVVEEEEMGRDGGNGGSGAAGGGGSGGKVEGGKVDMIAHLKRRQDVTKRKALIGLENLFRNVLEKGTLHLMFQQHTKGMLFNKSGGGRNGRKRLYIAILPERENHVNLENVHHCVLSDATVLHLESMGLLTDLIVANVVELRRMQVDDEIVVYVATAGEIFYPKLA